MNSHRTASGNHSTRTAIIGSTRVARRAGTKHAVSPDDKEDRGGNDIGCDDFHAQSLLCHPHPRYSTLANINPLLAVLLVAVGVRAIAAWPE